MNRRGFSSGLLASACAPAIAPITREAVKLFQNSNMFIKNIDSQYDDYFENAKIGSQLRIKLPNDYIVGK